MDNSDQFKDLIRQHEYLGYSNLTLHAIETGYASWQKTTSIIDSILYIQFLKKYIYNLFLDKNNSYDKNKTRLNKVISYLNEFYQLNYLNNKQLKTVLTDPAWIFFLNYCEDLKKDFPLIPELSKKDEIKQIEQIIQTHQLSLFGNTYGEHQFIQLILPKIKLRFEELSKNKKEYLNFLFFSINQHHHQFFEELAIFLGNKIKQFEPLNIKHLKFLNSLLLNQDPIPAFKPIKQLFFNSHYFLNTIYFMKKPEKELLNFFSFLDNINYKKTAYSKKIVDFIINDPEFQSLKKSIEIKQMENLIIYGSKKINHNSPPSLQIVDSNPTSVKKNKI